MAARSLAMAGLLGAAVGVPYAVTNAPQSWPQGWNGGASAETSATPSGATLPTPVAPVGRIHNIPLETLLALGDHQGVGLRSLGSQDDGPGRSAVVRRSRGGDHRPADDGRRRRYFVLLRRRGSVAANPAPRPHSRHHRTGSARRVPGHAEASAGFAGRSTLSSPRAARKHPFSAADTARTDPPTFGPTKQLRCRSGDEPSRVKLLGRTGTRASPAPFLPK